MRNTLTLLVVLLTPLTTQAACRTRVCNVRQARVVKNVAAKQTFSVSTVDVSFFAIPVIQSRTYSSSYDPATENGYFVPKTSAARPGAAVAGSDLQLILKKLSSIEDRINKLEGKAPPAPVPEPAPGPKPQASLKKTNLQVALTRCAGCHEAKVSQTKGGKLTLFEGDQLAKVLPADIVKKTFLALRSNKMPKQGKLLDGEPQKILDLIAGFKEDE